jgi:hypothetical protein
MPPSVATRKPIDQLSIEDLESFPVWEFLTDEEDVEGMDETWVKPLQCESIPEDHFSITVATVFKLNCGFIYPGLICCNTYAGFEVTAIALLTENDRFVFSEGTPHRHIAEAFTTLGLGKEQVFPVRYSTRVPRLSTGLLQQGTYEYPGITGAPGAA